MTLGDEESQQRLSYDVTILVLPRAWVEYLLSIPKYSSSGSEVEFWSSQDLPPDILTQADVRVQRDPQLPSQCT